MKTYANYTTFDAIGDMIVIYSIVVVISMLVALVIHGIVWVLSRRAAREAANAPPAAAAAATPAFDGIPEHHLAVIAASVTMMLGAHRIVRIQTPGRSYSWIAEGRSVHHTSHAPRGGSH